MLDKLGLTGVLGVLFMVAGVAVVAWKAPIVAAGLVAILLGLALTVRSAVRSLMGTFGF